MMDKRQIMIILALYSDIYLKSIAANPMQVQSAGKAQILYVYCYQLLPF